MLTKKVLFFVIVLSQRLFGGGDTLTMCVENISNKFSESSMMQSVLKSRAEEIPVSSGVSPRQLLQSFENDFKRHNLQGNFDFFHAFCQLSKMHSDAVSLFSEKYPIKKEILEQELDAKNFPFLLEKLKDSSFCLALKFPSSIRSNQIICIFEELRRGKRKDRGVIKKKKESEAVWACNNLVEADFSDVTVLGELHFKYLDHLKKFTWRCASLGPVDSGIVPALAEMAGLDVYRKVGDNKRFCPIKNLYSLTHLDVSFNDVTNLDTAEITKLPELKSLNISDNEIDDRGFRAIRSLKDTLNELIVFNTGITDLATSEIFSLTKLTSLDISSNAIGDGRCSSIRSIKDLVRLRASHIGLTNLATAGITDLQKLAYLDISHNLLCDNGCCAIRTSKDHLTDLLAFNTGLTDLAAAGISELHKLVHLDISNNEIGNEGFCSIKNNKDTLAALEAANTKITNLAEAGISELEKLTSIDISCNEIGNEGFSSIRKLGVQPTQLKALSVGITDLDSAGITELRGLTYLDVSENEMGDKGLSSIKKLGASLSHVKIACTGLTDLGVAGITDLPKLTYLDISNNPITDTGIARISELKDRLTELVTFNTGLSGEGKKLLRASLPSTKIIDN